MSDTPETDAAELIYDGEASGYADVDVCRKLERERDDARESFRKAVEEEIRATKDYFALCRERDAAAADRGWANI